VTGPDDQLVPLEGPTDPPLPAALVLHAQALEGMRRAHAELLARLDQGADTRGLVTALHELRDATERVAEAQSRAARRVARTRRRLTLVAGGLLLLAGAGAAAAGWAAREGRRADETEREGLRVAMTDLSAQLGRQQSALQDQLEGATAEREAALVLLAEARQAAESEAARAAELQRQQDELAAEATRERDLRLTEMGEAARVRAQLVAAEQRLSDLTRAVDTLAAARTEVPAGEADEAPAMVITAGSADNLARRITSVLRGSGVRLLSVVEVQAVSQGTLTNLLLRFSDPDGGAARIVRAGRGDIVVDRGLTGLRLLDVVTAEGESAPPELVPLPSIDRAAWEALGVFVPGGAASSSRLSQALGALLAPYGWQVAELRGCEGPALVGLRLEQVDSEGRVLRALRAERGTLGAGPELELRGGTLTVGADERAFYQDVYRLPLPGADLTAWQAALAAETR
jgi:hypothetical protein